MSKEWDAIRDDVRKKATELAQVDLEGILASKKSFDIEVSETEQKLWFERLVHKHMYEIGLYLLDFKGYGPETRRLRKLLNYKYK